ncbi:MAG: hypothetical protein ABR573_07655 [Candidatus Dormibacteria bacterium]
MPFKASLTSAWPRLFAHAIVLAALGGVWMWPHSTAAPLTAQRPHGSQVAAVSETPVRAMAERARVTTAMPVAGAPVQLPPVPVVTARSVPAAVPAPAVAPAPVPPATVSPARAGWGNDISWPQCDGAYPSGPHDIGVIGVTGGRPYTSNPCLASQFAWARGSGLPGGAQLYVNLELDGTSSGPHKCGSDDHGCRAYDYGWMTINDAFARAQAAGVQSGFWWLDVEVGNDWSDASPALNQATVQGAIDAVRSHGADVGIYSSVDQWAEIVPAAYRPGVPTWLAVVGDSGMAPGLCAASHSLTGGAVYMVQYDDHDFDKDHVCAAGAGGFAISGSRKVH